jgi:hypothetical protein
MSPATPGLAIHPPVEEAFLEKPSSDILERQTKRPWESCTLTCRSISGIKRKETEPGMWTGCDRTPLEFFDAFASPGFVISALHCGELRPLQRPLWLAVIAVHTHSIDQPSHKSCARPDARWRPGRSRLGKAERTFSPSRRLNRNKPSGKASQRCPVNACTSYYCLISIVKVHRAPRLAGRRRR